MARQTSCVSRLKQIGIYLILYSNDNNDYIPYALDAVASPNLKWPDCLVACGIMDADELLPPNGPDSRVLFCPEAPRFKSSYQHGYYKCSYGINQNVAGRRVPNPNNSTDVPRSLPSLSRPGQTALLFDAGAYAIYRDLTLTPSLGYFYMPGLLVNALVPWTPEAMARDAVQGRHPGKRISVIFADAHAEILPCSVITNAAFWGL